MKVIKFTEFIDSRGTRYLFEFWEYNLSMVVLYNGQGRATYTRLTNIVDNNQLWKNIQIEMNMSYEAVEYVEKFYRNKIFW